MADNLLYLINDSRSNSRRQDHIARAHTARRNRRQRKAQTRQELTSTARSHDLGKYTLASCQSTMLLATVAGTDTQHVPPVPTPRTVSPVFGALWVDTFSPASARNGGEGIAYYCQSVVLNYMSKDETRWFFEAYCRSPLVFHAIHYSVANHRDRAAGRLLESCSIVTIEHKVKALRLLNRAISAFRTGGTDISFLLLALTGLMRNEPTPDDLQPVKLLAFKPWTRNINNVDVFGRGKVGQTSQLHISAFEQILATPGDIATKLPLALAKSIAGHSLTVACGRLSKPRYPDMWSTNHLYHTLLDYDAGAGQGFSDHVPGGLPIGALKCLTYVCSVNKAVSRVPPSAVNEPWLRDAVRSAQHRLLSLEPRVTVQQDDSGGYDGTFYEICRLTAVLYANAALYSVPTSNQWHLGLLERLRALIEGDNTALVHPRSRPLMVWCLCVCSLAALNTHESVFYEESLRRLLEAQHIRSWEPVRAIAGQFLWSDSACGSAAAALCERIFN